MHAGENVSITVENCDDQTRTRIQQLSQNGTEETALNLDEIFEACVIGNQGRSCAAIAG